MKKILSFTLALLMILSSIAIMGVSAEEYDPKIGESLIIVMENSSEDEKIPVGMFTNVKMPDFMNIPEYIAYKGYDEKTISKEQRELLEAEFHDQYLPTVMDEIALLYKEVFEGVFEGATPDELYMSRYVPYMSFYTTKDKIVELPKCAVISDIHFIGVDPEKTPEEKAFLREYARAYGLDEDKTVMNNYVTIYGEASGYTLFELGSDVLVPWWYDVWIGDIRICVGNRGNDDNPTKIETLDKEGNYSTFSKVLAEGTLDIYEAHKILSCLYLRGDADLDKVLTIKDATRIQKITAKVKVEDLGGYDYYTMDTNSDDLVNIKDATWVQKKVANLAS